MFDVKIFFDESKFESFQSLLLQEYFFPIFLPGMQKRLSEVWLLSLLDLQTRLGSRLLPEERTERYTTIDYRSRRGPQAHFESREVNRPLIMRAIYVATSLRWSRLTLVCCRVCWVRTQVWFPVRCQAWTALSLFVIKRFLANLSQHLIYKLSVGKWKYFVEKNRQGLQTRNLQDNVEFAF